MIQVPERWKCHECGTQGQVWPGHDPDTDDVADLFPGSGAVAAATAGLLSLNPGSGDSGA